MRKIDYNRYARTEIANEVTRWREQQAALNVRPAPRQCGPQGAPFVDAALFNDSAIKGVSQVSALSDSRKPVFDVCDAEDLKMAQQPGLSPRVVILGVLLMTVLMIAFAVFGLFWSLADAPNYHEIGPGQNDPSRLLSGGPR